MRCVIVACELLHSCWCGELTGGAAVLMSA